MCGSNSGCTGRRWGNCENGHPRHSGGGPSPCGYGGAARKRRHAAVDATDSMRWMPSRRTSRRRIGRHGYLNVQVIAVSGGKTAEADYSVAPVGAAWRVEGGSDLVPSLSFNFAARLATLPAVAAAVGASAQAGFGTSVQLSSTSTSPEKSVGTTNRVLCIPPSSKRTPTGPGGAACRQAGRRGVPGHARGCVQRRRTRTASRRERPPYLFGGAGQQFRCLGSPAVPVWLFAPCSSHGLGGVAAGTAGA